MSTINLRVPGCFKQRRIGHCPTCNKRRRFVVYHHGNMYLGTHSVCCGCGDLWGEDGELLERPFARGWRQKAVNKVRRDYAQGGGSLLAWLERQVVNENE